MQFPYFLIFESYQLPFYSLDLGLLVLFTFFNIQRFFIWKDWD
jgi:hypothetical protein